MPHEGGESERLRKQKCKNHRKNPCKVTVLAFNLMGDALRDLLDPRLRGE
jgi:hypothetical protein